MNAPRLEIDLAKISANAAALNSRLGARGVSISGVTKATLGCPRIGKAMLDAGVSAIADSRIENIERLRAGLGPEPSMILIRSPMLSQADRVVASADISFNTELAVVETLSKAARAARKRHGVVLMVELGDLREGIMPDELAAIVRQTLRLPNIELKGIGTNLACLSGTTPDAANMAALSELASAVEREFGLSLAIVSGGNSANIDWALGAAEMGRIDNLRLGEAILFGREALNRTAIDGLHTDAFTLFAEVIESRLKPSQPWGAIAQNAFGEVKHAPDRGVINQAILAIGRQDSDPPGLGLPSRMTMLGSSSDHLVLDTGTVRLAVGDEVRLGINYTTLLRAMTSPFVEKMMSGKRTPILEAESKSLRSSAPARPSLH